MPFLWLWQTNNIYICLIRQVYICFIFLVLQYHCHMPAPFPSQKSDKFLLRLPDGVRQQVANAAEANNRTMTKEMVLRLQKSFDPTPDSLPLTVQIAIGDYAADKDCTPTEALTELVLAGQSMGRRVLNLRIGPGTTTTQVRDALNVALELAPDADLVFEREPKA